MEGDTRMSQGLTAKFKKAKTLYIQSLNKNTINQCMIADFLKGRGFQDSYEGLSVAWKLGVVIIVFKNHELAEKFYHQLNFNAVIMTRPLNIYFDIRLQSHQMKKFHLSGLEVKKMRKVFEIVNGLGYSKIYVKYTSTFKPIMSPHGTLSYIRSEDLSQLQFAGLKQKLTELGVDIAPIKERPLDQCSIKIINFYQKKKISPANFKEECEKCIRERIEPVVVDRIKDVQIVKTGGGKYYTAIVKFEDIEENLCNFELIREEFAKDKSEIKAILYFHNKEYDSPQILYTKNLKVPQGKMSEKQIEQELLNSFKKVNQYVLQVVIYRNKYKQSYNARIYFPDEESGKNFLVDYSAQRQQLVKHYIDPKNISIAIHMGDKGLKNEPRMVYMHQPDSQDLPMNGSYRPPRTDDQKKRGRFEDKQEKKRGGFDRQGEKPHYKPYDKPYDKQTNYIQDGRRYAEVPRSFHRTYYQEQSEPIRQQPIHINRNFGSQNSDYGNHRIEQWKTYSFLKKLFKTRIDFDMFMGQFGLVEFKDFKDVKPILSFIGKELKQVTMPIASLNKCNNQSYGLSKVKFRQYHP